MNTWNTKTHSSTDIAEFSFENADVIANTETVDEKQTVTFFRMCGNEALYTVHIFHLTPTQLVWNGVIQDFKI